MNSKQEHTLYIIELDTGTGEYKPILDTPDFEAAKAFLHNQRALTKNLKLTLTKETTTRESIDV